MDSFRFQQFEILQDKNVFRVGTDGVLLGALVDCKKAKKILEVGTGTGLISLMMAQRNTNAHILALDINENAVNLAQINFRNSPFHNMLKAELQDFKLFFIDEKFDLIVSNPPYFGTDYISKKDLLARHQIELTFEQLIQKSAELLSENGIFSVIIPKESEMNFIEICKKHALYLIRKIEIKGILNAPIKRCILEFSTHSSDLKTECLVLESSPRCYSNEYRELTKDFHIFRER